MPIFSFGSSQGLAPGFEFNQSATGKDKEYAGRTVLAPFCSFHARTKTYFSQITEPIHHFYYQTGCRSKFHHLVSWKNSH